MQRGKTFKYKGNTALIDGQIVGLNLHKHVYNTVCIVFSDDQ